MRCLVTWCRDWPVAALDREVGEPVAVVHANRVVAASAPARVAGVSEGIRRREARRRCPELVVVERDADREARAFERVVAVLDEVTPRVEVVRPGTVLLPTRGPSRYFGGDDALAVRVRELVRSQLRDPSGCGVGVADAAFPATVAALRSLGRPGAPPLVVAPGGSAQFLAPLPVGLLASPGPVDDDLVDVLVRLGLRRLGDVAALAPADVLGRFGVEGMVAHRLAAGTELHPPRLGPPPEDLAVAADLEPPAERVDQAAFAGKALADRLHARLAARALACTRLVVTAHTTDGVAVERTWRHELGLTAGDVAQRVRWQLDGWRSRPGAAEQGGICRLVLTPGEVVPDDGRQLGFWGGDREADVRARRAIARLQGRLGADAVTMPEPRGGRAPAETHGLVPVDLAGAEPDHRPPPWPGHIPAPHPSMVPPRPVVADLVDTDGRIVSVSGRGVLSSSPARLSVAGGPWQPISGWAGPWLYDERWWDATGHRRRARFQVVLADGTAHLVTLEGGRWWLEATYD